MMTMPEDDVVRDALRQVDDPEAGMNIVDLGLVYGIAIGEGKVDIELTMTTAACPMVDMIAEEALDAVTAVVPKGTVVNVEIVWDPPWTPDRMTGIAKDHFGWTS
jgi:metal-sulfur cluster biosynthetic enzyme